MGISPGCASSAITAWAIWSDFTSGFGFDLFLHAFPNKIPFLQIFAIQAHCGELSSSGSAVRAQSAEDYVWHIAQTYLNVGAKDPHLNSANQICENIPTGISLCCDSAFAHKKEFSIFKFPEWFLEISGREISQYFHFVDNSNHLKDLVIQSIGAFSFCICKAECLASSSQTFPQFIRPKDFKETICIQFKMQQQRNFPI